jgi:hypothetical protein
MRQKAYMVDTLTKKDNIIKIKMSLTKIPNKMHLDAQIHHPAKVHEDKRFKKPKYKNKEYDYGSY